MNARILTSLFFFFNYLDLIHLPIDYIHITHIFPQLLRVNIRNVIITSLLNVWSSIIWIENRYLESMKSKTPLEQVQYLI